MNPGVVLAASAVSMLVRVFPVSIPVSILSASLVAFRSLAPGVTRVVDPLGVLPWGALLEAGGIVAAVLSLLAASCPSLVVVVVGTILLVASSLVVSAFMFLFFDGDVNWVTLVDTGFPFRLTPMSFALRVTNSP